MDVVELPTLAEFVRRRRKPSADSGMSRQQLAAAINSSVGYLAKIEQGEAHCPSPNVLDALGTALGCDDDERAHLYRLAGQRPARPAGDPVPGPGIQLMLDALAPNPAVALNDRADIRAANAAFDAAFPGARADGNAVRWMFTSPYARLVLEDWEREAGSAVGKLRHYAARAREPEPLRHLLQELCGQPDFRRLWSSGRVVIRRAEPTLRLRDPRTGTVRTLVAQQFRAVHCDHPCRVLVGLTADSVVAQ